MNKQELIGKIEPLLDRCYERIQILDLIDQLDELQKPVVKQFVADWYEDNKDMLETNLFECIYEIYKKRGQNIFTTFEEWLVDEHTTPFQTLVNMHQFGYTVEKEKRYIVKMKGVNDYGCYLNKGLLSKEYFWESKAEIGGCRTKHTRKQLEDDDFGWVFDCEGIEIEEVEE